MTSFREFRGTEPQWGAEAWRAMCRVRDSAPLVQCITNFVSMDIMANTLLAGGAQPAMVHAVEEITEFTALSNALCINIGTLSPDWIFAMKVNINPLVQSRTDYLSADDMLVLEVVILIGTRIKTQCCVYTFVIITLKQRIVFFSKSLLVTRNLHILSVWKSWSRISGVTSFSSHIMKQLGA